MDAKQQNTELDRFIRCINVAMLIHSVWHDNKQLIEPSEQESIRILVELLGETDLLKILEETERLRIEIQESQNPVEIDELTITLSRKEGNLKYSIERSLHEAILKIQSLAIKLKLCSWSELSFLNRDSLEKGTINLYKLSILHRILDLPAKESKRAAKRRKKKKRRGPQGLLLTEVKKRIKLLQKWAKEQEKNVKPNRKSKVTLEQFAQKNNCSKNEIQVIQAWYRGMRKRKNLPYDPRTIKSEQIEELFA